MILFRLISFGIRLISTFIVVFILQIRFDGKTLEYYLVDMGKSFVGTKVLNRVGEDGKKALRTFKSKPKRESLNRRISSEILPKVEKWAEKVKMPYEQEDSHSESKKP